MVCEYDGLRTVWCVSMLVSGQYGVGVCRSQDSMVCEYDGLRTVWCVSMMVSGQYGV